MTLHGHFDIVGGISGDMALGTLLDALPELEAPLRADLHACGILDHVALEIETANVMGLRVRRAKVTVRDGAPPTRHWHDIRTFLETANCHSEIRDHAIAIFTHLAEAESVCHGVDVEHVHFHEVADWDSLADILGAASLIVRSDIKSWSCSALPIGSGTVMSAHGILPVPAPATVELLKGFVLKSDDELGERVTPTGAAILRHLVIEPMAKPPSGRLMATGTGAGERRLKRYPNILRLLVTDRPEAGVGDMVTRLSFEIDDMTPEELSVALDRIRAHSSIVDAGYQVGIGKKGRMRFSVDVLVASEHTEEAIALCFTETATIGLRVDDQLRRVLRRLDGPPGVKRVARPGGNTAKIESDVVATVPTLKARRRNSDAVERNEP
ncbi:LarC family nickel insertion protein [Telmatospirillum siberiense]|uniref:LarC family nickel insertion protein n=1 Tax=Telmatospirillum siberiense TaxID=382514 RepID=A0A2N3PWL7_9PROT|nr:LarC family nickel insertion protein [Telmatospirillum siberiense]PKU24797.1 hypothetical protein CWS72_09405 [Telmatospirillum siberiense]